MENSEDSDLSNTPPDLAVKAKSIVLNLLPQKSRDKYEKQYQLFQSWLVKNNVIPNKISENILLAYLSEKSEVLQSPTLWIVYSMLKATIQVHNDIDISVFKKLTTFLKRQSVGYKPKKSKVLNGNEVIDFLKCAPENDYLLKKVVLIFGVSGACRVDELTKMSMDDVEDKGSVLIVKVPESKGYKRRIFTICNNDSGDGVNYLEITRKYLNLRPKKTTNRRLFLRYSNGVCYNQPVGINTISKIPSEIAKFLKLSEPSLYTGHCFRRSSATILVAGGDITQLKRHGGWKSNAVAEGYIEESLSNKIAAGKKVLGSSAGLSNIQQVLGSSDGPSNSSNVQQFHQSTTVQELSTTSSYTPTNAGTITYDYKNATFTNCTFVYK